MKRGTKVTAPGTIIVDMRIEKRILFPRNRKRAKANPPNAQDITSPNVDSTEILVLLRKYRANGCCLNTSM
jgi:hypothetical protein